LETPTVFGNGMVLLFVGLIVITDMHVICRSEARLFRRLRIYHIFGRHFIIVCY